MREQVDALVADWFDSRQTRDFKSLSKVSARKLREPVQAAVDQVLTEDGELTEFLRKLDDKDKLAKQFAFVAVPEIGIEYAEQFFDWLIKNRGLGGLFDLSGRHRSFYIPRFEGTPFPSMDWKFVLAEDHSGGFVDPRFVHSQVLSENEEAERYRRPCTLQVFLDGFEKFTPSGMTAVDFMTYLTLMRRDLLIGEDWRSLDRSANGLKRFTLLSDIVSELPKEGEIADVKGVYVTTSYLDDVVPSYMTSARTASTDAGIPEWGDGSSWHVRAEIPFLRMSKSKTGLEFQVAGK